MKKYVLRQDFQTHATTAFGGSRIRIPAHQKLRLQLDFKSQSFNATEQSSYREDQ
jgi:hypothetical protein